MAPGVTPCTADALVALGMPGHGAAASDLGFAGLVVGGMSDVETYVRAQLGPVLDYDTRRVVTTS